MQVSALLAVRRKLAVRGALLDPSPAKGEESTSIVVKVWEGVSDEFHSQHRKCDVSLSVRKLNWLICRCCSFVTPVDMLCRY